MARTRAVAKPKSVQVTLSDPQEKTQVVRYNNKEDGAVMASAYVDKVALKALGNPAAIRITIEPA